MITLLSLFPILSLVTTTKDYYEIVHKLMEFHPSYSATDYTELGSFISYAVLTMKNFFIEMLTFNWLKNVWSLPIIVPDIASAMVSEISVLDGYFHNAFTFLETPLSYGKQNYSFYGLEKFSIGFINSFFLFLPTSAAHVIFFRRLVFQGIEGGYVAGIGIIAGNILWLTSIIFGWRFFVIPWLSLDILRYLLGFVILIKFMWHASRDKRILTNFSKSKIFLVNFLLAFTEQTNLYPFVTNISVGAESSILETFPVDNLGQFMFVHSAYIIGILAGSISLLNLTCWLWENPIAQIYYWLKSKIYMPNFYKNLNFLFLYLTMLCTISSFPYFGLDYTLTNPLGLVSDDRIFYQKNKKTGQAQFPEIDFLNAQASDRNARDSRGRHGRRERWKERLIKYRGMDTSLYNQGVYNLLTVEDLNYGFDKFWLRKQIRNHPSHFRFVPTKILLMNLKTQLAKPRLLTNEGARVEVFRMIYELFYHPNFHAYSHKPIKTALPSPSEGPSYGAMEAFSSPSDMKSPRSASLLKEGALVPTASYPKEGVRTPPLPWPGAAMEPPANKEAGEGNPSDGRAVEVQESSFVLKSDRTSIDSFSRTAGREGKGSAINSTKLENAHIFSALRKFVRKVNTRIKTSEILLEKTASENRSSDGASSKPIYSKRWKEIYPSVARGSIRMTAPDLPSPGLLTAILREGHGRGDVRQGKTPENFSGFTHQIKGSFPSSVAEEGRYFNSLKIPMNELKTNWQKKNIFPSLAAQGNSTGASNLNTTNYMQKEKLSKKDRQILRYKTKLASIVGPSTTPLRWPSLAGPSDGDGGPSEGASDANEPFWRAGGAGHGGAIFEKSEKEKFKDDLIRSDNRDLEVNSAKTMLHPIKFYLQKEKAFKRKFKFYGASVFRKLSIENNAPYFRTMMKRLFYYYKPTLRWTNTFKLAKNKQGHKVRKKSSRAPLKFIAENYSAPSMARGGHRTPIASDSDTPFPRSVAPIRWPSEGASDVNEPFWRASDGGAFKIRSDGFFGEGDLEDKLRFLKEPTHHFRIAGKNSSRHRNLIFKQALFNWYYTPFNRILSKLDVDLFIRRQPNSHFLTKKDEQGLHLKRFLLAEHYDTLRWYTYMQHYRAMKTKIGGTKSFASRFAYNQQFQGTFKKIRHLFAITPSAFPSETPSILPTTKRDGDANGTTASFEQPSYSGIGASSSSSIARGSMAAPGLPSPGLLTAMEGHGGGVRIRSDGTPALRRTEGGKKLYENQNILKFDQPLYNEYSNTEKNSIINNSVLHEELLSSFRPSEFPSLSTEKRALLTHPSEGLSSQKPRLSPAEGGVSIRIANPGASDAPPSMALHRRQKAWRWKAGGGHSDRALLNLNLTRPEESEGTQSDRREALGRSFYEDRGFSAKVGQKDDLIAQSTLIVRKYLKTAKPIRQKTIKDFLLKKNYKELTKFILIGQKIRGIKAVTNQRLLVNQERLSLANGPLSLRMKGLLTSMDSSSEGQPLGHRTSNSESFQKTWPMLRSDGKTAGMELKMNYIMEQDLWFTLLKNYKKGLYNKEFITQFLERRTKKREKREQKKDSKELQNRLERLQKWLSPNRSQGTITDSDAASPSIASDGGDQRTPSFGGTKGDREAILSGKNFLTTGLKNAIKDSVRPALARSDDQGLLILPEDKNLPSLLIQKTSDQDAKKVREISLILNQRKQKRESSSHPIRPPSPGAAMERLAPLWVGSSLKKTKIISFFVKTKMREIINFILNEPTLFFRLKPITKKQIKNWDIKDRMFKNRKSLRKKYRNEIKKAQNNVNNNPLFNAPSFQGKESLSEDPAFNAAQSFYGAPSESPPPAMGGVRTSGSYGQADPKEDSRKNEQFLPTVFNKSLLQITDRNSENAKGYTISNKIKKKLAFSYQKKGEKQTFESKAEPERQKKARSEEEYLLSELNKSSEKIKNKGSSDRVSTNEGLINFKYFNTLFKIGEKYDIKQKFKLQKNKSRRNRRYGRPRRPVEHPSYTANIERKAANMILEKRLQTFLRSAAITGASPSASSLSALNPALYQKTGAPSEWPPLAFHRQARRWILRAMEGVHQKAMGGIKETSFFPNLVRKIKKSKKKNWNKLKYKKSINSEKAEKARKQSIDAIAILRAGVLTKQIKRVQFNLKLQQWWWQKYLPNLQANTEATLQFEKERRFEQLMAKLSTTEILERDSINTRHPFDAASTPSDSSGAPSESPRPSYGAMDSSGDRGVLPHSIFGPRFVTPRFSRSEASEGKGGDNKEATFLQIGDYDFKPLAIPQSLRIRDNLIKQKLLLTNPNLISTNKTDLSSLPKKLGLPSLLTSEGPSFGSEAMKGLLIGAGEAPTLQEVGSIGKNVLFSKQNTKSQLFTFLIKQRAFFQNKWVTNFSLVEDFPSASNEVAPPSMGGGAHRAPSDKRPILPSNLINKLYMNIFNLSLSPLLVEEKTKIRRNNSNDQGAAMDSSSEGPSYRYARAGGPLQGVAPWGSPSLAGGGPRWVQSKGLLTPIEGHRTPSGAASPPPGMQGGGASEGPYDGDRRAMEGAMSEKRVIKIKKLGQPANKPLSLFTQNSLLNSWSFNALASEAPAPSFRYARAGGPPRWHGVALDGRARPSRAIEPLQGVAPLLSEAMEGGAGPSRGQRILNTNPLPFYAGWDESLRKFVVTNRLLTRREAGYSATLLSSSLISSNNNNYSEKIEFSSAPLQGMNAGTTMYCQLPFTTFAPDQLYKKGMDGFAPIGWRRFEFTHTILKTKALQKWLNLRSKKINNFTLDQPAALRSSSVALQSEASRSEVRTSGDPVDPPSMEGHFVDAKPLLIKNITLREASSYSGPAKIETYDTIKRSYTQYARRLQRHYKRTRRLLNEKVPVFLMSGPLINEVLPVNYINIFNKQNRLSKDRYLKRRLRRGKKEVPKTISEMNSFAAQIVKVNSSSQSRLLQGKEGNPFDGSPEGKGSESEERVATPLWVSQSESPSYSDKKEQGIYDFTFRRRLKTRRKYHRKSSYPKGVEVRPRRHELRSVSIALRNGPSVASEAKESDRGAPWPPPAMEGVVELVPSHGSEAIEREVEGPQSTGLKEGRNQLTKKVWVENNKLIRKRPTRRRSKRKLKDGGASAGKNAADANKIKPNSPLNSRLRQLRRRVSRQIIKPIPSRRPRAGGFVWTGDYLRLEETEFPKLILATASPTSPSFKGSNVAGVSRNEQRDGRGSETPQPLEKSGEGPKNPSLLTATSYGATDSSSEGPLKADKQKISRKIDNKVLLFNLYAQPRQYLLEKHNVKVIKKKLEKAQRSNQIKQRIKELELLNSF